MRALLAALLLSVPAPAMAAGWNHYTNVRFGYAIDVPPGFVGRGEAANGDGQVFRTPTATLTVFGGNIMAGNFEGEVVQRERDAEQDKWAVTYQVSTPTHASYSGKHGARVLYGRMVALCRGRQYAMFELQYSSVDIATFNPIIDRLVASLQPTEGSASC
jgi:hypothetical protein